MEDEKKTTKQNNFEQELKNEPKITLSKPKDEEDEKKRKKSFFWWIIALIVILLVGGYLIREYTKKDRVDFQQQIIIELVTEI